MGLFYTYCGQYLPALKHEMFNIVIRNVFLSRCVKTKRILIIWIATYRKTVVGSISKHFTLKSDLFLGVSAKLFLNERELVLESLCESGCSLHYTM